MTSKSLALTLLLTLMAIGSGCSMFTDKKGSKKSSPWESMKFWKKEYQTPTKMAVLWSPDLLTVAGQPPTRGFGGRIYFYNERSQTIPVDGELVVHGFDESRKKATGSDENLPDKRFRFTAEQFTEHFSQSEIGASYSVWIPWDTNETAQKELTLIPTFVSSSGQMVQGAAAKVIIPGKLAGQPNLSTPVQTVAFEQSTVPTVEGKLPQLNLPVRDIEKLQNPESNDMRVTTIKLPAAMNRNARSSIDHNATAINNASNQVQAGNMAQAQPAISAHVNAQLDQMRAQAVADAFRPLDQLPPSMYQNVPQRGAPTNGSWTPGEIPSASMRATNLKNITPPNYLQTNQAAPAINSGAFQPGSGNYGPMNSGANNGAMNSGAMNSGQAAPARPATSSFNSNGPYRGDDYPGGLPPGFQLSPQGTAW